MQQLDVLTPRARPLSLHAAENKVAIAAAGGIRLVLAAMERHPDVAEVQRLACGARDMLR